MEDIKVGQVTTSDLINWFEAFLIDRQSIRLSLKTVQFYREGLVKFLKFCQLHRVTRVNQIIPVFLRRYLLWLESEGLSPNSVHGAWRTIRCFLNWYEIENPDPDWKNPTRNIRVRVPKTEPLEPADIEAVKAILATCDQNFKDDHWKSRYEYFNLRDKVIILTLLDTGLRASELLALTIDNINPITGVVQVVHGKGGKNRTVYIGRKTRQQLRRYLKQYEKRIGKGPLFLNQHDGPITVNGLNQMLSKRAKMAGVEKQSPHAFRRLFAVTMLRNGVDLISLQMLMGHADLQMLKRYLKLSQRDTLQAHIKGGPVDRLI